MKCRTDIKGRKIWIDDDNLYGTRPPSTEIELLRDGETYKTITLNSDGDGVYKFPCLIIWKNANEKYVYQVDEPIVPDGYTKTIQGYNIVNTLSDITVSGIKRWVDNNDEEGFRPESITVRLLQNGVVVDTQEIDSPPPAQDTAEINFGTRAFADSQGVPYVYTVNEDPVVNYQTTVDGFNITNTFGIFPFTFTKKCIRTQMSLQGAEFEIRQNGVLKGSAVSDLNGIVAFSIGTGTFQMAETQPPAGYMANITVYEVVVDNNGNITVDGQPASGFAIENRPMTFELNLNRATDTVAAYRTEPNAWALHGDIEPDLFMTDKITIIPQAVPATVKWDYGVKTAAYFAAGGGYNITGSYVNGLPVNTNGDYTVYALFSNGYETVATINVDRIRDGSTAMPYLLINYATAASLEPSVTGISQFTLDYMKGGGVKLAQNYEIYENIQMTGKLWEPLGTVIYPYTVSEGFRGTLYGNGHDIIGLSNKVARVDDFAALFKGVTDGARIEKLGIINSDIGGVYYPAGFAGCVNINGGTVTLKDLRFTGSVTGTGYAGSMVAYANIDGGLLDISGCGIDAIIKGGSSVGGVIGVCFLQAAGELTIDGCSAAGSVSNTTSNVAGIAGNINSKGGSSAITNCINAMAVNGLSAAGGILGTIIPQAVIQVKISSCYNKGEITGITDIGGIAGIFGRYSYPSNLSIENCYNSGTVTATRISGGISCGGLVALLYPGSSIKNSYNVGNVFSVSEDSSISFFYAGGISAYYGNVTNCASAGSTVSNPKNTAARVSPYLTTSGALSNNMAFNNMQVLINGVPKSPLDEGAAKVDGLSVTAAQIKTQNLYETGLGWDFTDVWSFGNGGYTLPILRGIPVNMQPDILPAHL